MDELTEEERTIVKDYMTDVLDAVKDHCEWNEQEQVEEALLHHAIAKYTELMEKYPNRQYYKNRRRLCCEQIYFLLQEKKDKLIDLEVEKTINWLNPETL